MVRYRNRVRGRGRGGGDGELTEGRGGGQRGGNASPGGVGGSEFSGGMRDGGSPTRRILRRGMNIRGRGGRGRGIGFSRGGGFGGGDSSISRGEFSGHGSFISRGRPRNCRNRNSKKWGRLVSTIEKQVKAEVQKCVECKKDDPPYRCPTCFKKYCSVWCCKTHVAGSKCVPIAQILKTSNESAGPISCSRRKSSVPKQYLYPSEDTVPPGTLAQLNQQPNRDKLLMMFKNKNLREKIGAIDNSPDSVRLFDTYMKDEEFASFSSFVVEALGDKFVDDVSNNMAQLQVQKAV